jgi:hypothetical protein
MKMRLTVLLAAVVLALSGTAAPGADDGFIPLFNGKDLDGWKASENPGSFKVEEGVLIVAGPRGHLFYTGPVNSASFTNFQLRAQVKTMPNANSGIYFHTEYQDKGWPAKGYECQVNNTHKDVKKTGGLYAIADVLDKSPVVDNEWFDYFIEVQGKRIIIKINGVTTTDFTEPDGWTPPEKMPGRKLSSGTIAIQAHDPGSVIHYRNIQIKPLP